MADFPETIKNSQKAQKFSGKILSKFEWLIEKETQIGQNALVWKTTSQKAKKLLEKFLKVLIRDWLEEKNRFFFHLSVWDRLFANLSVLKANLSVLFAGHIRAKKKIIETTEKRQEKTCVTNCFLFLLLFKSSYISNCWFIFA